MNKGFTILELLIVIALIALLAGVVITATNATRGKGADSAIKENLANARVQAALYHDVHEAFCLNLTGPGGSCDIGAIFQDNPATCTTPNTVFATGDTDGINMMIQAAADTYNPASDAERCAMDDFGTQWSAYVPLREGGFWCVDSSGYAGTLIDADHDGDCGS